MSEWVCRSLRDGGQPGEHAPALSINDTLTTCQLASFVFQHFLSHLSSFLSSNNLQSKGIVLLAFSHSPLYYQQFFNNQGYHSPAWIQVLDCYTDPLGWNKKLLERGVIKNRDPGCSIRTTLCTDAKHLDNLLSTIIQIGQELAGKDGKGRFMVAIDSVSEMVRHTTVSSVASLVSNLRSHAQVSSLFWLLHSDLHDIRETAAFEYMSSMQAKVEPKSQPRDAQTSLFLDEENFRRGNFCVRAIRRNGRVRNMFEEISVEKSGIKFAAVSAEDKLSAHSLVPKVQFNLQLSEKELNDRANVVLPFEHQGNGKTIEIYDGRKSLSKEMIDTENDPAEKVCSGKGEIIYLRDSDDEMPDSDEDPDDDLDI